MSEEITVRQDTTLHTTGKWQFVVGLGGMLALLTAGMMYGTMRADVATLKDETHALRVELQTRETKDAVSLMFGNVIARLSRIEALLDRSPTTTPTSGRP